MCSWRGKDVPPEELEQMLGAQGPSDEANVVSYQRFLREAGITTPLPVTDIVDLTYFPIYRSLFWYHPLTEKVLGNKPSIADFKWSYRLISSDGNKEETPKIITLEQALRLIFF